MTVLRLLTINGIIRISAAGSGQLFAFLLADRMSGHAGLMRSFPASDYATLIGSGEPLCKPSFNSSKALGTKCADRPQEDRFIHDSQAPNADHAWGFQPRDGEVCVALADQFVEVADILFELRRYHADEPILIVSGYFSQ